MNEKKKGTLTMSKVKERLRAMGIEYRLGTQEEADEIGILMFSVPDLTPSKKDTQEKQEPESPAEE